nr:hypothetical protein JVH1_2842 [Rhodococcus sp. JVH1]
MSRRRCGNADHAAADTPGRSGRPEESPMNWVDIDIFPPPIANLLHPLAALTNNGTGS